MGLFSRFKKAPPSPYPPEEQAFWRLYAESLQCKDRGALKSALEKREEALRSACPDRGYEGMALHNLAILTLYHLGKGQTAAKYARDSLACGDDYYRCSEAHRAELRFGAHLESLQEATITASSYDEALDFSRQGEKYYGDIFTAKIKEIEDFRKEYPRFADYQRQTTLLYYSRVSPQLDQGDYAPAMGLLQLMLDRAEEPAYDLSYEEYVDLLDDYGTITAMYLMKKARQLGGPPEGFAAELAFIAEEPLQHIADFLPDCQSGDRQKFINIVRALATYPGVKELPVFKTINF